MASRRDVETMLQLVNRELMLPPDRRYRVEWGTKKGCIVVPIDGVDTMITKEHRPGELMLWAHAWLDGAQAVKGYKSDPLPWGPDRDAESTIPDTDEAVSEDEEVTEDADEDEDAEPRLEGAM